MIQRVVASAAEPKPVRVVIVGGGAAGLSAAWQLCKLNDARRLMPPGKRARHPRYEVTVYEAGWCLGGKGASMRDRHGRILEHGLHVWLGFYENAFRMMRECYGHLQSEAYRAYAPGRRLVHDRFEDAFAPEPHIGVASRRAGRWETWTAFLPPMKGEPGSPLDLATNPFSAWAYLSRALALSKALLQSVLAPSAAASGGPGPTKRSEIDEALELDFSFDPATSPEALVDRLATMTRAALLTTAAGVLQAATFLENLLRERNLAPQVSSSLLRLVEAMATSTRRQLQDLVLVDETMRRRTEILDLISTILIGLYRDRVFMSREGLDAIDAIDYRDWLDKHGATRDALDSPLVTGMYDLVFGYRDGDHARPALSAAQAVRGAMRMFLGYRGSMFWRLRSGMGDAIFAPLFRALVSRGVAFRFLHRLADVQFDFDSGDARVASLRFESAGDPALTAAVDPLDDAGCWPDDPLARFGVAIETKVDDPPPLQADEDFDAVILATGLDDVVALGGHGGLFDHLPQWERMRRRMRTVATRSAQVWLSRDLDELGWDRGPVMVAGLDAPARDDPDPPDRLFETWADMTHTLAAERDWRKAHDQPDADAVRSVAYFCSTVRDEDVKGLSPQEGEQHVREALRRFLAERTRTLWPAAHRDGGTPLDALLCADGTQPERADPLAQQHVMLNAHGSARYTQALPGSGTCRISPLDPGFSNMTVAGDWTDCGFNGGCVEAAVMSGMLAAHAVSGRLDLNHVVGYHHP